MAQPTVLGSAATVQIASDPQGPLVSRASALRLVVRDRYLGRPLPPLDAPESYLRSARAVVGALLPGSAQIPRADDGTIARAEEAVLSFDERALSVWRAAVRALDYAAVPWSGRPLHALPESERQRVVRAWEQSPVLRDAVTPIAAVFKLVHFDEPRVYEALGARRRPPSRSEPDGQGLRGVHAAEAWPDSEALECDVVIVGTGAGGAVVGRELAERGHAVVFVEEGDYVPRTGFDGSSVRAHARFYRRGFSVGNVPMPIFAGRLVGGSTAINTGTCFRTPPWVLERWCEDLGTEELSSEALERHFDRVEARLGVAPAPLDRVGPIAAIMARGCNRLGWSHGPVQRNAPECTGDGFCDFGCRSGARRSTEVSYLPAALQRGSVVLTGLRARTVLVERGRAVGVEGVTRSGRTLRVRAKRVVLAGGAIPTPQLLLRQGIGNRSDQVGRNLTVHPSAGFAALFDDQVDAHRHIPQGYQCDEFLREGQLLMTAQADVNYMPMQLQFAGTRLMEVAGKHRHLAAFALLISDSAPRGRVHGELKGLPAVRYDLAPADVQRMHTLMVRTGELCMAAGARTLFPGARSAPVLEGPADFRTFRETLPKARDLTWLSYHPLGTCKMGRDPKTSVVGLDHQSHDVRDLFVVDGSTVPGPIGVNPQVTIMALATRAAEHIDRSL